MHLVWNLLRVYFWCMLYSTSIHIHIYFLGSDTTHNGTAIDMKRATASTMWLNWNQSYNPHWRYMCVRKTTEFSPKHKSKADRKMHVPIAMQSSVQAIAWHIPLRMEIKVRNECFHGYMLPVCVCDGECKRLCVCMCGELQIICSFNQNARNVHIHQPSTHTNAHRHHQNNDNFT